MKTFLVVKEIQSLVFMLIKFLQLVTNKIFLYILQHVDYLYILNGTLMLILKAWVIYDINKNTLASIF